MSEIAVAQMRHRMLRETEGFLSEKLALVRRNPNQAREEFNKYVRQIELKRHQVVALSTAAGFTL